LVRIW